MNMLKKICLFAMEMFGELLEVIGAFTLTVLYHTLSLTAMRRYGRWIKAANKVVQEAGTAATDYGVDLVFFRGRLGSIDFNAEQEYCDGHVIVRKFGNLTMVPVYFRCENRWAIRSGRPTYRQLNELMTRALEGGYPVARVIWDGRQMSPYHLASLGLHRSPDDVVLPPEVRWEESQETAQYKGDPLGRHTGIIQRVA